MQSGKQPPIHNGGESSGESSTSDSKMLQGALGDRDPCIQGGKSLNRIDCLTSHVSRLGTSAERRESGSHTHDRLGAQYMRDGRSKFVCLTDGALPLILDSCEWQRSHDADDTRLPSSGKIDDLSDDAHRIGRLSRFLKMPRRRRLPALPQQSSLFECDESSASDSDSEMSQGKLGDQDPLLSVGKSSGKIDSLGPQNGRSKFACLTEGALPRMINDSKLPSADMFQDLSDDARSIGRSSSFSKVRHRIPACPKRSSYLESDESSTSDSESSQGESLDSVSGEQPFVDTIDDTNAPSAEMSARSYIDEDVAKFRKVNVTLDNQFSDESGNCTHDPLAAPTLRDDSSQLMSFTKDSIQAVFDSGERPLVLNTDDKKTRRSAEMRKKSCNVAHRSGRHLKFPNARHRMPTTPEVNAIPVDDLPGVSGSRTSDSVGAQRMCDGRSKFVCRTEDVLPCILEELHEEPLAHDTDDTKLPFDGRSKFVCRTEDVLPCILEDLHEEPLAHDTDDTQLPCAEMNEESSRGVGGLGRLARYLKTRRRHRTPAVPKQRPEIDNAVKIAKEGILAKISEFDEKKKIVRPMLEGGLLTSSASVVAAVGCCNGEQVVRKTPSMAREALGVINSVASAITNC